jgi:ribosomal protein L16 Arg81 hydroxylase
METKKEVKPLQVRLPSDVYASLQYVASAKGGTLNSVVVECLRNNLPYTTWSDQALVRDFYTAERTPEQHRSNALENLNLYQGKVLHELSLLGALTQLRLNQISHTVNIDKVLRNAWPVLQPLDSEDAEQSRPHMDIFAASNTVGHKKEEQKVADLLKAIARARTEAYIEWDLFNRHLDRLIEAGKKGE